MVRLMQVALIVLTGLSAVGAAAAQESKAAQATRKKLQQKLDLDLKEIGTKAFFEEVNLELKQPINFKFDNVSGVSNNSKMTFKKKGVTVENLLNELADKYDWGWVVISNAANNRVDGWVVIRKAKDKERGYEAGKGPKKTVDKTSSLPTAPRFDTLSRSPAARAGRQHTSAFAYGKRLNGDGI